MAARQRHDPQLTNIRNKAGVQAVVNPGFGQGSGDRDAQLLISSEFGSPLYQSHGVASQSSSSNSPARPAEGVRLPAAALLVADKLPGQRVRRERSSLGSTSGPTREHQPGEPVSTFGGHAYDGLMILVEAMQRAKSADTSKVRDEIERTKGYIGTGGIVNMSATDHMVWTLSAFPYVGIEGGDLMLVAGT